MSKYHERPHLGICSAADLGHLRTRKEGKTCDNLEIQKLQVNLIGQRKKRFLDVMWVDSYAKIMISRNHKGRI